MIGEAGYETSEESSDFKDVREMRADKTQTWLSAGFGDDSPHEFVGTIMPDSRSLTRREGRRRPLRVKS